MDYSGNVQKYATQWEFLVNVKPVFWDPNPIYASGMEGREHVIYGTLKNNSSVSKAFSLNTEDSEFIYYPDWLTPTQSRGTLLPTGDYTLSFAVDAKLKPGIYQDTITALVDEKLVSTPVTFELLAQTINWAFDPATYDYDMTVVAQFSLDGTEFLLSSDSRDRIGAFVNGQIRGIAQIEYVEATGSYVAFLRVHSNDKGGGKGETVTFRFWRALTGVEYGAEETLIFSSDAHYGTVGRPVILHPEGQFQVIPLRKGWNWVSLNLTNDDMSREHLLQSLLNSASDNDIVVKSMSQSTEYSPTSGWNGNLRNLTLGNGYLLHLSNAPDTLKLVGLPSPDPLTISPTKDWNWIGYPRLSAEPVNDVLAGLTPGAQDLLKSETDFSVFEPTVSRWAGSLREFLPGEGYKLKFSGRGAILHPVQKSLDFEVDRERFEYNMNVTATFDAAALGEEEVADLRVVALINGESRGNAALEYCPGVGAYRAFLLVSGNREDSDLPLDFRVVNLETGREHVGNGEARVFRTDDLIGSASDPYPIFQSTTGTADLERSGFGLGQNQPNPATLTTTISLSLPSAQHVRLELYEVSGRSVLTAIDAELGAGNHRIEVEVGALPAGIYSYRMTAGDYDRSRRMVVH